MVGRYCLAAKGQYMDKLWNKSFITISISNFLMFFSFYALLPVLPLYIFENLKGGHTISGVILALYTIGALFCRPFAGYLVDNFSRKKLYFLTYLIFSFMFLGYLVSFTLVIIGFIRFFHGVSFGIVTTSSNTLAVDVLPSSRRGEGIGYFGVATNIAFALGPMSGMLIFEAYHFNAVFISSFITGLVGLILVYFLKVPRKPIKNCNNCPLSLDRFFLTKATPQFFNMMLVGFAYGPITNYLALYAKELNITQGVGFFYALLSLGLVTSRLLTGRFIDRGYLNTLISLGLLLLAFSYAGFSFINSASLFFSLAFFIGFGHGLVGPSFQTMVINMAPHSKRGTASSTFLSSWDLGIGTGILLGGFLAKHFKYSGVYLIGSIGVLLAFIFFVVFVSSHYNRNKIET